MINNNDLITVNKEKFISSSFGDEIMLMNLESGDYIALNAVSADIYKLAEEKTTAEEIIKSLLNSYNVEEEECRSQALICIESMMEKQMLIKL
jgi:hypothetical protein